ncbi:hypothetical protein AA0242T_2838 [Acetobacter aceti NRIC 0242]|uniref:Schlafen group 3-like DNA/RNA helicase domain-containing protein n=1 Tax=Acetobacter aceti NBRC 14818 TaxID=887700 RepID=A0AB33IK71_ACEAC|nr:DUF2075 domain-containing protein [Acetobacter aceti]TCS32727.1 hypothetical protein EDC15_111110 [Acetobacter aceti NBRC 14818]BCK77378.1 hypothetical protein EMQ_2984 [Acetobacter aceti NBRC 14818]GAN58460.1 hypothetical protein Abac_052_031 [Acetobacter aceti NBRC 14818]GBO82136.1 hypothetical protein AA0242T_2838 [Acetobacter aceti NRIC 0242]
MTPASKTTVSDDSTASVARLSPTFSLTETQKHLVDDIIGFCRKHIHDRQAVLILEGDAGTGKSLVLNTAFSRIQEEARSRNSTLPLHGTSNTLLVNHPEMIKLYRNIAADIPTLRKKDYERPTSFINTLHKTAGQADIVFIDEAHLLLTRSDPYNHFRQSNQLEEILKLARVVVMVFDPRQTLKFKGYWDDAHLRTLLQGIPTETIHLTDQFRVQAHPDVMRWIRAFCDGKLLPLPEKQAFDFRIYDDAERMYQDIREYDHRCGLSRILATYDFPYTLNGNDHFVQTGSFHLRWDRNQPSHPLPWAERPDSIDEVGSVYTVQGFDLNYAGVILGPSVSYDKTTDRIILDPTFYEDSAAFIGRGSFGDTDTAKRHVMANALFVIFTRARKGLLIYAHDEALRARLHTLWGNRT